MSIIKEKKDGSFFCYAGSLPQLYFLALPRVLKNRIRQIRMRGCPKQVSSFNSLKTTKRVSTMNKQLYMTSPYLFPRESLLNQVQKDFFKSFCTWFLLIVSCRMPAGREFLVWHSICIIYWA